MSPLSFVTPTELSANLRSKFDTWAAGFDAATNSELTGLPAICPFFGMQAKSWRSGFAASRRVTELAEEL